MKSSVYKIENLKDTFNNINSSAEAARRTELINIHSAPGSEIHEDLIAHHHGINALDNEGDFIISGSAKGHNPSYFYPIINRHGRHLGKFELSDEMPGKQHLHQSWWYSGCGEYTCNQHRRDLWHKC